MKTAFVWLQWTPKTFWGSTLTEYFAAIEALGDKHPDPEAVDAPTADEIADLLDRYG